MEQPGMLQWGFHKNLLYGSPRAVAAASQSVCEVITRQPWVAGSLAAGDDQSQPPDVLTMKAAVGL